MGGLTWTALNIVIYVKRSWKAVTYIFLMLKNVNSVKEAK